MRPHRIVLHAFGPYPGTVEVDFERLAAHGLFLVHGPTGSGKSTVLDAMTYALFGDDKDGPERTGREFASAHAPLERTRVELLFSIGGERFRVVRYPSQRVARSRGGGSDGVEKPAEARLERLAADGTVAETVAEKAQDVGRAVQERLGCTVAQFRQTVVLPQGAFREVVTDEKARRAVLERLFDTGRFARLTTRLKSVAAEARQAADLQRRQHDEVLARAGVPHPDDLRALRATAATAHDERAARRHDRDRERSERLASLRRGEAHAARFERLDAVRARQAELDAEAPAMAAAADRLEASARAATLDAAADRRRAAREAAEQAVARRDEAAAAMATATDGARAADARHRAEAGRSAEREAARTLARRLADLEGAVALLAAQRRDRERHAAEAANHRAAAAEHEAARAAAERERTDLERERDGLRLLAAEADTRRDRRDAAAARSSARAQVSELDARVAAADAALADQADDDLLALLRDHAAGLAAADLADGAPCPVCGSVHHPRPHAPADVAELGEALTAVRQRAAALAAERERRRSALAERRALLERHGWRERLPTAEEAEADAAAAEEALQAALAARDRLAAVEPRLDTLRADAERHAHRASAATLAAERAQHEADALERDVARTSSALPADAQDPDGFARRLADARAAEADLEGALETARAAAATAAAELATATARLDERTAQAARAEGEARASEATFETGLAAAGFADEGAYAAARLDDDTARRSRVAWDAHRDARVATTAQAAELAGELAGFERPDLAALRAESEAAEAAWRAADDDAAAAQRRLDQLDAWLADLARADDRYRALLTRHAAAVRLAQVASGSVKGRPKVDLETFVLQRRFLDVLRLGNAHLQEMTAGRYTLHLVRDGGRPSDTGLDLEVADHHVGGARRPARTLSGGEGFLAALSLALGLSDVAQRARHPIEALFIDEGFGSLDRDTLDLVTHTLRTLPRAAGRVVGIVSHVEDLRRLIPVQLVVTPGEGGSSLRVEVNA